MKKIYIKPSAIAELLETECHILELSNWKTNAAYSDIQNQNLIEGQSVYTPGTGTDAGAKKNNTVFFGDDEESDW